MDYDNQVAAFPNEVCGNFDKTFTAPENGVLELSLHDDAAGNSQSIRIFRNWIEMPQFHFNHNTTDSSECLMLMHTILLNKGDVLRIRATKATPNMTCIEPSWFTPWRK